MITVFSLNLTAYYHGPNRPWQSLTMNTQPTALFAGDPVRCLEGIHGRRVKGTLKTNPRTGLRQCEFFKQHDGYTATVRASWFQPKEQPCE